ncbi:hypothetical protein COCMIDRAFT_23133 [Bipolaris oryzae ATCC 44560]|uniref:Uncharacterized protein n=1 Tax=Bipolaris oryzae ATCC 44560 TaxID=930090 RepID=W6ZGJ0_COCMI|nr:uncharacterized protein COCMIDRAFT_23133 [Bipolaris oryzae ATCC 44560]EUC49150.1 hypothetical protein COCMIDRAFT_23133 [Bipolaris oryzae ATCC 44560]
MLSIYISRAVMTARGRVPRSDVVEPASDKRPSLLTGTLEERSACLDNVNTGNGGFHVGIHMLSVLAVPRELWLSTFPMLPSDARRFIMWRVWYVISGCGCAGRV